VRITETVFEGERPGEGWHAHGWTSKGLWVVHDDRLVWLRLHKRRWLRVETGQTCHSRPVWDVPHSPYGLDVVFCVLGAWLLAVQGLHHVAWPWSHQQPERPARRTAQRMLRRLALDADRWLLGLRLALTDIVAPRPLEEILPTGGIPPPEGCTHVTQRSAHASKLRGAVWIANCGVQSFHISMRRLLGVARRRSTEHRGQ
jgi:hypothetical protein